MDDTVAPVGAVRMPPVLVPAFLRAFPIQTRQVRLGGGVDARRLREPRQKILTDVAGTEDTNSHLTSNDGQLAMTTIGRTASGPAGAGFRRKRCPSDDTL